MIDNRNNQLITIDDYNDPNLYDDQRYVQQLVPNIVAPIPDYPVFVEVIDNYEIQIETPDNPIEDIVPTQKKANWLLLLAIGTGIYFATKTNKNKKQKL